MKRFLSVPAFRIGRSKYWVLDGDLIYLSKIFSKTIVFKKGTETNLANLPHPAKLIFSVNGDHRLASVVHDLLYDANGVHPDIGFYSRMDADREFYHALIASDVHKAKAKAFFYSVVLLGWIFWYWPRLKARFLTMLNL